MTTHNLTLMDGLKVGDQVHKTATLRTANVGDIRAATHDSERLVIGDDGPILVASDFEVGIHTLRRQITKLGDLIGPIDSNVMNSLSLADLDLLQAASLFLERADVSPPKVAKGAARRGRAKGRAAVPSG